MKNNELPQTENRDLCFLSGKAVIDQMIEAGINRNEIDGLIAKIKKHYKVGTPTTFLSYMGVSLNSYQERMLRNPEAVSSEEFIGHVRVSQGSSFEALRESVGKFPEFKQVFDTLIGAIIEKEQPNILFLSPKEASLYSQKFDRKRKDFKENKEKDKKHQMDFLKDITDQYKKNYSQRKYRLDKFSTLAFQVANILSVKGSSHLSVSEDRAAYEVNLADINPNAPEKHWSIISSIIQRLLKTGIEARFIHPDNWPNDKKTLFLSKVLNQEAPSLSLKVMDNTPVMFEDDHELADADSSDTLKDLFETPDDFLYKLIEKTLPEELAEFTDIKHSYHKARIS